MTAQKIIKLSIDEVLSSITNDYTRYSESKKNNHIKKAFDDIVINPLMCYNFILSDGYFFSIRIWSQDTRQEEN
jgi:hypothetical protein